MENELVNVVVGITGASGSLYADALLTRLQELQMDGVVGHIAVIFSRYGQEVWDFEVGEKLYEGEDFHIFSDDNFYAGCASGSGIYNRMVVVPCSMGTLGRIAHGVSDSLLTRAADVMLKERHQLIVCPREAPYSLIHLNNMKLITEAGGIVFPCSPSFYSKPDSISALAASLADRIIGSMGLGRFGFSWGVE